MRRQQTSKPKRGLIVGLSAVIVVLVVVIGVLLLNTVGAQHQAAKQTTRTNRHSTKYSAMKVTKSSDSKTDDTTTTDANSSSTDSEQGIDSLLSDFSQSACEDPATRTNGGDITYSQFYYSNDDANWHWRFWSTKRGQVENATVSSASSEGSDDIVALKSDKYEPGTGYVAHLTWLNDAHTKYNFKTSFKNIDGDYTIGKAAMTDYADVNDIATSSDIKGWLSSNVTGRTSEDASTRTNGGEITYSEFDKIGELWYWTLSSKKRGVIAQALINSGTISGDTAKIHATSTAQPYLNRNFELTVSLRTGGYSVDTDFQSIHGAYNFK